VVQCHLQQERRSQTVLVIGEGKIGPSDSASSSLPAQFNVTIPTDADPGARSRTAIGRTNRWKRSSILLLSTSISNARICLFRYLATHRPFSSILGTTGIPLAILATFSDGTTLDATHSSYVSFSSSNTAVATVDKGHGIVTQLWQGRLISPLGTPLEAAKFSSSFSNDGKSAVAGITSSGTFFVERLSWPAKPSFQVTARHFRFLPASSFDGFAGSVALSINGLPPSASASFATSSVPISSPPR